jgi:hypothetical protein
MSRVMELVTEDPVETVSKRAYTAFRRIGRVNGYKPTEYVEGKVYIDGWPALLTVEWSPHRDGVRTRVDISATSADELSRAADEAMYKFAAAFKHVEPGQYIEPTSGKGKVLAWVTAGAVVIGTVAAYYFGLRPH